MEQKELEAKLREAMSDEAFVKSLLKMEEPEQVRSALAEKDIVVSTEDVVRLKELLIRAQENGGELSEDDLTDVSGGMAVALLVAVLGGCALLLVGVGGGLIIDAEVRRNRW